MTGKVFLGGFFLSILTAAGAGAASYCAVFTWGKHCGYETYEECLRAAGNPRGCEINPVDGTPTAETAHYCLVTPDETKCIFDTFPACRFAASIENSEIIKQAECVENPNR